MATASKINILPDNTGLWGIRQEESVAQKATELLQKDMENHHVFFNNEGFHNHVSHQILALFGTGASAEVLARGYVENENYQRPSMKPHDDKLIEELRDWDKAKKRLAKEQYYSDWLTFFQHEIERLGWQKTLAEYMFKGDERSQDMMVRMYAGFLHPLIQLMYGVEWDQPAIVAMALAQACVHGDELRKFLVTADAEAQSASTPMPRIADMLEAAAGNETLRASPRLSDSNKIRDGVLARAWDEAIRAAGQVKIRPEELAERTAEMFNTAIYEATSAALRPGKDPKYEFFLMHHVNVAPIFVTLNKQDWISTEQKVQLLEWKIRMDIVQYVARGCPELSLDKIANYVPKDQEPKPATDLLPRMHGFVDDGHAIKLWRAVFVGRAVSAPYEDRAPWLRIQGRLWDQVGRIIVDAVEAPGPTWVRNAGFAEAWENVSDAPRL